MALEQRRDRIVSARRRAVAQRREFEAVAVEEEHQLLAARAAAAGRGERGHEVRHLLLLETGELDQAAFARGVAQEPVGMAAALL